MEIIVNSIRNGNSLTNQDWSSINVGNTSVMIAIGYSRVVDSSNQFGMTKEEHIKNTSDYVKKHHKGICPKVSDILNKKTKLDIITTNKVCCPHPGTDGHKDVGVVLNYVLRNDGADQPEHDKYGSTTFKAMHYTMEINNKQLFYIVDHLITNRQENLSKLSTNERSIYNAMKMGQISHTSRNPVLLGIVNKIGEYSIGYTSSMKKRNNDGLLYAESFKIDHIAIVPNARYSKCTTMYFNEGKKKNGSIVIKVWGGTTKKINNNNSTGRDNILGFQKKKKMSTGTTSTTDAKPQDDKATTETVPTDPPTQSTSVDISNAQKQLFVLTKKFNLSKEQVSKIPKETMMLMNSGLESIFNEEKDKMKEHEKRALQMVQDIKNGYKGLYKEDMKVDVVNQVSDIAHTKNYFKVMDVLLKVLNEKNKQVNKPADVAVQDKKITDQVAVTNSLDKNPNEVNYLGFAKLFDKMNRNFCTKVEKRLNTENRELLNSIKNSKK